MLSKSLVVALWALPLLAQPPIPRPCEERLDRAAQALTICLELRDEQEVAITTLKNQVKQLEEATKPTEDVLPWWAWVLVGAAGGIVGYTVLH